MRLFCRSVQWFIADSIHCQLGKRKRTVEAIPDLVGASYLRALVFVVF